jgi:hypothetical protein
MDVQVSWLAVILAAISSMAVGFIWYAKPVFGEQWMKLAGLKDKDMKEGMGQAMAIVALMSILTAFVLAHMIFIVDRFFGGSFLSNSLWTAFWLWLGISATTIVTHGLFEQRRKKLLLLSVGNRLVTLLVMGLVIGLVGI